MSAAEIASVSSEFDIFAHIPFQTAVLEAIETRYQRSAPADQNDLEYFIPADDDTYIDLVIKLYVRGKLISCSGKVVDTEDHTAVTNNFIQFLFSRCNVTLNGVTITQTSEDYDYRSYLGTLNYGSDATGTHLTNAYWYRDTRDM